MKLFELTKRIEQIASEYPNMNYIEESGDIYNLNAHNDVKYTAFCALPQGLNVTDNLDGTQTANYSYTLFYVDRLMNDNGNKLAIFSNGDEFFKYLLERLYDELDITYTNYNSTNFTERFNDECAGVYVTLDLNVPMDSDCYSTLGEVEDINKQIRDRLNEINGTRQGKTIMDKLDVTDSLRAQLAANIDYKGVPTSEDEGLNTLVPKVMQIESVNLTPTNTLLDSDLGCYIQKYYNAEYPVIIGYKIVPLQVNREFVKMTSPYTCNHVVINGEVVSLIEGQEVEIQHITYIAYMFPTEEGEAITELKTLYPDTGNIGQIRGVYSLGTKFDYVSHELANPTGSTSTSVWLEYMDIEMAKQVVWNSPKVIPYIGTSSHPLRTLRVRGLEEFSSNIRNFSFGYATVGIFPDLKKIDTTNNYPGTLLSITTGRFMDKSTEIMPNLEYVNGKPYGITNDTAATTQKWYFPKVKYWRVPNTAAFAKFFGTTDKEFSNIVTYEVITPDCTDFTFVTGSPGASTPHSVVTDIVVGTVTHFNCETGTTSPNRMYILQNVEVGEDTDINLNLIGFAALYATDRTMYATDQEVEEECLKVITNIRNGLLNKVKDHSQDGETRTITLTNLIDNFSNNATPAVASAVNQLIEAFNAKGWTVQ